MRKLTITLIMCITLLFSFYSLSAIQARADKPRTDATYTDATMGIEFVLVKGGCFQMGCGSWTNSCYDDEKPVHEVCVDTFYIGKYEVTQGQWRKVTGNNPSDFKTCGDNCPVEEVSWNDVQEFIRKLNQRLGDKKYRLPGGVRRSLPAVDAPPAANRVEPARAWQARRATLTAAIHWM